MVVLIASASLCWACSGSSGRSGHLGRPLAGAADGGDDLAERVAAGAVVGHLGPVAVVQLRLHGEERQRVEADVLEAGVRVGRVRRPGETGLLREEVHEVGEGERRSGHGAGPFDCGGVANESGGAPPAGDWTSWREPRAGAGKAGAEASATDAARTSSSGSRRSRNWTSWRSDVTSGSRSSARCRAMVVCTPGPSTRISASARSIRRIA